MLVNVRGLCYTLRAVADAATDFFTLSRVHLFIIL
jgi:hypothetical protein